MRIVLFLITVSITQAFALDTYAQTTRLSLDFKNETIIKILEKIEDQSEFYFMFDQTIIDVNQRRSINCENKSVTNVLDEIFKDSGITYRIEDRQIALSSSKIIKSQQQSISGKVTDEKGSPLPGVTILIKGTTQGTVTNAEGVYSLSDIPDGATLQFSFVGMLTQEIEVGSQTTINVTMKTDAIGLEEVVAIGYGTQTRQTITTAISKLDNKVLENVPYSNAANAMKGTLAGVRVQTISGQPGASPRIIVRGGTSINNPDGAHPLYVIDGVTRDNMNGINPADIESIQVLKDAASTAIYGTLGSNGVVIVTTKSGKAGKMQVNYKYDLTFAETSRRYDLLQGEDFVYYARLGMKATAELDPSRAGLLVASSYIGGIGNDLTKNTWSSMQYLTPDNKHKLNEGWKSMPDPLDPSKTIIFSDTDYQDILFRTAVSHNHSLSLSGGSEKAKFNLGIGYSDNEGIAVMTDYKRFSLNFSGDMKISDNISAFARVMYSNTSDTQVYNNSIFKVGIMMPPTNKLYFEDGTLSPGRNLSYANPIYAQSIHRPKNLKNDLTLIVGGQIGILQNLTFTPQLSLNQKTSYSRNFRTAFWNGVSNFNNSRNANASFYEMFSPQFSGVFSYDNSFGDHNIEAKGGFSYVGKDTDYFKATGTGAATDLIPTLNASAEAVSVYGTETHHVLMGYFSRILYDYKQKYMVNASFRYDGASNLGDNNKWGFFPGISMGWNVDREDFWTKLPDGLKLKLRGSYGINGNISGLGLYQAQGEYSANAKYDSNSAIQISVLPNQELQWERSKTFNVGADIGFFDRRIGIMVDWYRRVTDNLLTTLEMPPSTGFGGIMTNYGSLENKGLEIAVTAHIMPPTSDFQWNVSLNNAKVNTRILKLPENGVENNRVGGVNVWDSELGDYTWKGGLQEGGRIGELYGHKQVSIYATDEEAAAGPVDIYIPLADKTKYGGDVNWLDADGNNIIDSQDRVYMGNKYPDVTGGFTNLFAYKNLSLNIRMDYTLGGTVYYEVGARLEGNFSGANAISSKILRSWKEQGDITDIPKYHWADQVVRNNVGNARPSSRYFQKTDYLSIREVTLAYDLPRNLLNKIKLHNLRLHITGSNLYYFTKYEGLNPEQSSGDTAYPVPREFIFGASINF